MSFILKGLYNILLLPLASIRLCLKAYKDKAYQKSVRERYGFFDKKKIAPYINNTDILLHVVSLGEFIASERVIIKLIEKYPDKKIVISCTTPTAREKILQRFRSNEVFLCYLPYDNKFIINNFIKKLRPKLTVFVEKEIWPNLYAVLKKVHSKIVIINASLNNKSFKSYQKINKLILPSIQNIDYVCAQDAISAENFSKLGVIEDKVKVYGNIKYDLEYPGDLDILSNQYNQILNLNDKTVIIAASTHEGEEKAVIESFIQLKKRYKELYLILVPRHPHRFQKVYELIKSYKLEPIKFTELINNNLYDSEVLLLDTIGKLLYFYKLSDIAFVGGSLIENIGCHNILEPAMFKLPIVIGPNYFNFASIVENFKKNKAINIIDSQSLTDIIQNLLENNDVKAQQGNAAYNEFIKGQGVLDKTLLKLEYFLKSS